MKPELISIIIPVKNRNDVIGNTLDSIISQTYTNWECIVVDGGSTDGSLDRLNYYQKKDNRINYLEITNSDKTGANTCRNLGLLRAQGNYLEFFDSDDIMLPRHLEVIVKELIPGKFDFITGRTDVFNDKTEESSGLPQLLTYGSFSATDFAKNQVTWHINDVLLNATSVKNLQFNENLNYDSGYNFFLRYLLTGAKGRWSSEVITKRRLHKHSKSFEINTNKLKFLRNQSLIYFQTYKDIINCSNKRILNIVLEKHMFYLFNMARVHQIPPNLLKTLMYITLSRSVKKHFYL